MSAARVSVKQLSLLDRQVFGLDAEVVALVVRHFMGQLVDLCLTPVEFPILQRNGLGVLADQFAQFIGAELIEVGRRQGHDRHHAVSKMG